MKTIFTVIALLTTITTAAHADFVAGRVRTDAVAKMRIKEASGAFQAVRTADVSELNADGKGLAGYVVDMDGAAIRFDAFLPINEFGCAKIYRLAAATKMNANSTVEMKIYDYSHSPCTNIRVEAQWEVIVTKKNLNSNETSSITLVGNPEYLMLTL